MSKLNILYLEDSPQDAELTVRVLKKSGMDFSLKQIDNEKEYRSALFEYDPDIILSDHSLYQFNSLEALKIFKESGLKIPFILVTGTVSEEFAVTVLKEGADDYLLKDNLTRLPSAIHNSLEKFRMAEERQKYLENVIAKEAMMKAAESLACFGSWQANLATNETIWSDEIFRIYGYQPGEILPCYDSFLAHVHPEEIDSLKQRLDEALLNLDSFECESRIVDKSGNVKYINNKILIKRDEGGQALMLIGFNQDITKRKEAEEKFRSTFEELVKVEKELSEQQLNQQKIITETTIQAQEREREELAKELHDNINQILASAKMYLNIAGNDESRRLELVRRSYDNVTTAVEEIRKLCRSLIAPSLGDIGLKEALQELAEEINLTRQFEVSLDFQKEANKKLDSNLELMLYRIAQEQMNNIVKYARASRVFIHFSTDSKNIYFSIKDNGIGFDTNKKASGIGLKNIRSRIEFYFGRLAVVSSPGKGCSLEITIPI